MTDIASTALGDKGKLKLEFKEGALVLSVDYDGKMFDAGMSVKVDAESVLQALKLAVPGKIDDLVIDEIIAFLKKS